MEMFPLPCVIQAWGNIHHQVPWAVERSIPSNGVHSWVHLSRKTHLPPRKDQKCHETIGKAAYHIPAPGPRCHHSVMEQAAGRGKPENPCRWQDRETGNEPNASLGGIMGTHNSG